MKYRVKIDLSFEQREHAQEIMDFASARSGNAVSIREGSEEEEISYCDLELCGHDEGLPCTRLDRIEIRREVQP